MTSDVKEVEAGASVILDQMLSENIIPEHLERAKMAIARAVISKARPTIFNEAIEAAAKEAEKKFEDISWNSHYRAGGYAIADAIRFLKLPEGK